MSDRHPAALSGLVGSPVRGFNHGQPAFTERVLIDDFRFQFQLLVHFSNRPADGAGQFDVYFDGFDDGEFVIGGNGRAYLPYLGKCYIPVVLLEKIRDPNRYLTAIRFGPNAFRVVKTVGMEWSLNQH